MKMVVNKCFFVSYIVVILKIQNYLGVHNWKVSSVFIIYYVRKLYSVIIYLVSYIVISVICIYEET